MNYKYFNKKIYFDSKEAVSGIKHNYLKVKIKSTHTHQLMQTQPRQGSFVETIFPEHTVVNKNTSINNSTYRTS